MITCFRWKKGNLEKNWSRLGNEHMNKVRGGSTKSTHLYYIANMVEMRTFRWPTLYIILIYKTKLLTADPESGSNQSMIRNPDRIDPPLIYFTRPLLMISYLHSVRSFHTKLNEIPSMRLKWTLHEFSPYHTGRLYWNMSKIKKFKTHYCDFWHSLYKK